MGLSISGMAVRSSATMRQWIRPAEEQCATSDLYQSHANEYKRNGELAGIVRRVSAQLHLPNEYRIPVPCNHTDMVKFLAPSDKTYCSVASHMEVEVGHILIESSMYFNDEWPSIIMLTMVS
jgi:hypothetical protein